MLPSTGYFKVTNCPFFASGLCERPYCHYRHVKKEPIDSLPPVNSTLGLEGNGEILQQLVSEAVKKVLQQTEILPSALASSSNSDANESVPQSLVTKVVEELTPSSSSSTGSQRSNKAVIHQPKVPSYKPTPIAVLRKRHIPIPYSPSLSKNSIVLLKRRNSSDSKKGKLNQEYEPDGDSSDRDDIQPSLLSVKSRGGAYGTDGIHLDMSVDEKEVESGNYESDYNPYTTDIEKQPGYGSQTEYSPVPVSGWEETCHSYTPSTIDSLLSDQNYIPSSRNVDLQTVKYEPSDKSKSSSEPTYIPVGADGSVVESTTYKPSSVSHLEPEYQPLSSDTVTKEYVPTDISKLDNMDNEEDANVDLDSLASDIDLLHDILYEDLKENVSDHEEAEDNSRQNSIKDRDSRIHCQANSGGIGIILNGESRLCSGTSRSLDRGKRERSKSMDVASNKGSEKENDLDKRTEGSNKRKRESERHKSDGSRKLSGSDVKRRKSDDKHSEEDRRRSESDKRHSTRDKKGSGGDRKQSDRKKSDSECERSRDHHRDRDHSRHRKRSSSKSRDCDRKRSSDKKGSSTEKKHSSSVSQNGKHSSSKLRDSEKWSSSSERHKSTHSECNEKEVQKHKDRSKSSHHISSNHSKKELSKYGKESKHSRESSREKHSKSKSSSNYKASAGKSSSIKSDTSKCLSKRGISVSSTRSNSGDLRGASKKQKLQSDHLSDSHDEASGSDIDSVMSESENSEEFNLLNSATLPSDMGSNSDDDVTKECLRIFKEYEPTKVPSAPHVPKKTSESLEGSEPIVTGKRRIAHEASQNSNLIKHIPIKHSAPNPAVMLAERYRKLKEAQAAQAAAVNSLGENTALSATAVPSIKTNSSAINTPLSGRIRIAHVPNVSLLLNAKMKVQERLKERQMLPGNVKPVPSTSATVPQSAPKGGQRVAHIPSSNVLAKPIISDVGGKIPTNVRQKYLNLMIDEYLKLGSPEEEAFEKALQEEKAIYGRSTTRIIYASHMSNTISRLRKGMQNRSEGCASLLSTSKPAMSSNRVMSHTSVLTGKGGTKGSWSIEKPKKAPTITNLYEEFYRFVMSEEELKNNGYPCAHPEEKGVAVVHAFYKKPFLPEDSLQRHCARCSRTYFVNRKGYAVKEEQCIYHWGRIFQSRVHGLWESRYNCCQGHAEAIGCSVAACHVSDSFDPNCMRGFVKTLPKDDPPPNGDYGVYALDCEMCYTTAGLELTRVTVIATSLETVYETLVKPENPILDYNTRFSGITEEDMKSVRTNIYEVQSALLSFISDKTILVGHSLESDFKALKIIHQTVVDTSVVFPHKQGPPKKRALKNLCRELLQKLIQDGDGGHDSAEDAKACMELMLYKIKEELKKC